MFSLRPRAVSWRVLLQMATVGASTGLVKVAAAAKVIVTARAFGTSDGLDAYLIAFLLPAFVLVGGTPLIDQSIAATLGSGSVAALNYGTRVAAVLIAMGPAAVATAILPHFSRLTVSEDWSHIRRSLRGYAAVIVTCALPVVAVLILVSEPMVRLFFERGQFTGAATELVTRVQRFSLLQIPAALVLALVLRFISSIKANRLLLHVAGWYAVSNVGLDFALARWMGVAGIPLATAMVQLGALVYLLRLAKTRLPLVAAGVLTRAAAPAP